MSNPARKFRVAHLITRLCKGGAQVNTFQSVLLSDRTRFDVDLISGPTDGHEGSIEDMVAAGGVSVIRVPELVRPVAPVRDWLALRRLVRLFKERRYDIVHTHTSKAGYLGRVAARRAGVPIIVHTPHGNIFHGYFSSPVTRIFIALERRAAGITDRIVTLTPGGVGEHLAQGIGTRDQFKTIFSGIDLSPYEAARERRSTTRRELGIAPDEFLVGGVGRIEPVKGFEYFVAAANIIVTAVPKARFILAGHGSLEKKLRAAASCLGDQFQLLGTRDDVPDLMAAMDLCVVPSLNEGMGRVVLEAGAAGTPVVASNVGGIPDVIDNGETGILVSPRDETAIAHAVTTLAHDPERLRRMGEAARAHVVPRYGHMHMVQQIEALYNELLKEKGLDR